MILPAGRVDCFLADAMEINCWASEFFVAQRGSANAAQETYRGGAGNGLGQSLSAEKRGGVGASPAQSIKHFSENTRIEPQVER